MSCWDLQVLCVKLQSVVIYTDHWDLRPLWPFLLLLLLLLFLIFFRPLLLLWYPLLRPEEEKPLFSSFATSAYSLLVAGNTVHGAFWLFVFSSWETLRFVAARGIWWSLRQSYEGMGRCWRFTVLCELRICYKNILDTLYATPVRSCSRTRARSWRLIWSLRPAKHTSSFPFRETKPRTPALRATKTT